MNVSLENVLASMSHFHPLMVSFSSTTTPLTSILIPSSFRVNIGKEQAAILNMN